MKVLLLVQGLPVGGTEVMVCHLARRLRALGIGVAVGCLDSIGDLGQRLQSEGFEVELYGRRPGFDAGLVWRIARSVRRGGFDVVHAHQYTCFFYAALAKFLARVPLVFTEHGRFYPDLPSGKRRLFNRLFSGKADRITAVSRGVLESLERIEGFDPKKIEVVYNGVDLEKLARASCAVHEAAKARLGLPAGAKVVGTIGRLDPIKNQPLLLHAFARILSSLPNAHLIVAGDGPEMEKLRRIAERLGISDRVRFLGQRSDVDQVFAALDVFALSSFSEGTPMTLIEAMAASTPIVSTAVGGIPEIIRDGKEGLLVGGVPPPMDAENDPRAAEYIKRFANALRRLLVEPDLAADLTRNALERARREFSIEAITDRYLTLYREVTKGPRSAPFASAGTPAGQSAVNTQP